MNDREDTQMTRLQEAYDRVRACGETRRHDLHAELEEIERLEREALAAYEQRMRRQAN